MARRFLARAVHGYIDEDALASIDKLTRRTNLEIPEDAEMFFDEDNSIMFWVWDDGLPAEKNEEEN